MKNNYLLSIDGATEISGYAVFDKNTKELVHYGKIHIPRKDNPVMRDRVILMMEGFSEIMDEWNPSEVVMEEVPPALNNSSTVLALGILSGIILGLAHTHHLKVNYVSVSTWHSKLGILKSKGNLKEQSINWVNKRHNMDLLYKSPTSIKNQDNEADAIAIGTFWLDSKENKAGGFGTRR